jgi:hypothetical protein
MEDLLDTVVNAGLDFINICVGAYCPVDRKIHKILPIDFPLGNAISSWALASSMTFPQMLSNPPIASSPVRK